MSNQEGIVKSIVNRLAKSEPFANLIFSIVLLVLKVFFGLKVAKFPHLKNRVKEKNLTVQIKLKDSSRGRYFTFRDGLPVCHWKLMGPFNGLPDGNAGPGQT